MDAKEIVAIIAEEAYRKYHDGTGFFDYLDNELSNNIHLMSYLYNKILDDGVPDAVLGSGKFGWAFSMYGAYGMLPIFNFPGDLRHQALNDPGYDPNFFGREFVYVDNSVYKGRTLGQINQYVEKYGGTIRRAYIFYDGSRPPYDWTLWGIDAEYLYRWHDGGFRP